ncbi:hypothetical protein CLNEO_27090 [Anaerotignum neopropionicum]|uniref:DUF3784 domain-containing protein n=1 Tax=Anaerotignum neopropionicum TaxID=36847 RepID=A0A136WBG2_9FIRM|nr:hypothetical protein [Anaerotignum neopropionicum]KXL51853.1 hypothetical protein CLNEO_27090 [Anaerotignum neopropionicum]
MLLYTILLACISIFFFREGMLLVQMKSRLLPDFNKEPSLAKNAGRQLFFISICAALSAVIMLFSLIYRQITHTPSPKIGLALAFLVYGFGIIIGMYRCYKLKKMLPS